MAIGASMTRALVRGCGTREQGGVYMECGLGEDGLPVEMFLRDRPLVITREQYGLSDVGIKLYKDKRGTYHIIDIVGEKGYRDPVRFIEEVRRLGLSRRAASTTPFHLLTPDRVDPATGEFIPGSRIMLAHRRAQIVNFPEYYTARNMFDGGPRLAWNDPEIRTDGYFWKYCVQDAVLPEFHRFMRYDRVRLRKPHDQLGMDIEGTSGMCAGLWWEDVEESDDTPRSAAGKQRDVIVRMPSFDFLAKVTPFHIKPRRALAVFMTMPITNLVVVKGDGENESVKRLTDNGMQVLENGDQYGADLVERHGSIPVFRVDH